MSEKTKRCLTFVPIAVCLLLLSVLGVRWVFGQTSAETEYANAMSAFESADWTEAAQRFESFLLTFPQSELSRSAKLYAGVSHSRATEPSGDPFLAVAEDREFATTRLRAQSLIASFRTECAALLADPTLTTEARDLIELEMLRSWELERDYPTLLAEAESIASVSAANPTKHAAALVYKGIAAANIALANDQALTSAGAILDSVFAIDYGQLPIQGGLADTLTAAVHWRIWCAVQLNDLETAGDLVLYTESSLPDRPARRRVLSRYSSLVQ